MKVELFHTGEIYIINAGNAEGDVEMKDVMILTGAGQIGMVIARRMEYGIYPCLWLCDG